MASAEIFRELQSDKENSHCFDCKRAGAQWASVNNAIFLCFDCSSQHRGLGVQSSFVRSTTMDSWTPQQLTIMSIGGNRRLKEFMEVYMIQPDLNIYTKYNCQGLQYYREILKNEADNKIYQGVPPNTAQARVSNVAPPPARPTYTSICSRPYNPEPENKGWMDTAKTYVGSAIEKASEIVSNTSSNGIIGSLKNVTVSAYDLSKGIGSTISDSISSGSLKSIGETTVAAITAVGGIAYEGAQNAIYRVKGKKDNYSSFNDHSSSNTGERFFSREKSKEYAGSNGYYQPPQVEEQSSYSRSNTYTNYSSDKLNVPNRNKNFFLGK
jgi:Putative GTPase activating protein for Arf